MGGVSQRREALVEFATRFKQPAAPGIELVETARYRVTVQPDFPVPGPNSASCIRCRSDEASEVINGARAIFARHRLRFMWILDPETEPEDFPNHLADHDVFAEPEAPEVAVMVLPINAEVRAPAVPGLEIRDALADIETFRAADAVNAAAFGDSPRGSTPDRAAAQERRRRDQLAAGNRRLLLATVDGEPAGSAGLTLFPPFGAIVNGGAVLDKFRGRGVYRALIAERLRLARDAGVPGLSVWGGPMSKPILARLGFETVGWRRFYPDNSQAEVR